METTSPAKQAEMAILYYRYITGDVTLVKDIIEDNDKKKGTHTVELARRRRIGADDEWVLRQSDADLKRKRDSEMLEREQRRLDREREFQMQKEYEERRKKMQEEQLYWQRSNEELDKRIKKTEYQLQLSREERERDMQEHQLQLQEYKQKMQELDITSREEREQNMQEHQLQLQEYKQKMQELDITSRISLTKDRVKIPGIKQDELRAERRRYQNTTESASQDNDTFKSSEGCATAKSKRSRKRTTLDTTAKRLKLKKLNQFWS
ncbi:hypothetical protein CYMTET_27552 [Cymbomonas tetramitiformis]|uniref:Uncharacterized protein n=1 Tax=Cymbomonas tetramitiformis TaxID=36881 RepID=A0AAE0FPI9_9CHLO|nr:hypothetical protein CYMTET_27552 [Cymbomonas tetramitiformis]